MKDFIKRRLRESLEYNHVVGDATKDKFQISEYWEVEETPLSLELEKLSSQKLHPGAMEMALMKIEAKYSKEYAEFPGDNYSVIDAMLEVMPRTLVSIFSHIHPKIENRLEEYGDYDFDDDEEEDEFADVLDMPQDKPTNQRSGDIKAYHGTPNKIKNFSDEFVGGADANDQEGPGIYFTTKREEAIKYAGANGFIYDVNLKTNNLVSDENRHDLDYLTEPVTKLIKMSPNWKQVAKSFDEGLDDMVAKYVHRTESEKEAFVGLYSDVYKGNAVAYVRNMSKLGYDGVYLPASDGGAHVVIYDPSLITVTGGKQV